MRCGVGGVVTGEDFTFGRAKGGNAAVHGRAGAARTASPTIRSGRWRCDGESVSSSRIREALQRGDPRDAARLLTRPFAIEGVVQHGDKVGREIGYPTANLDLGNYLRPAYGIYAVRGRLADGRVLDGAANLGIRPTFDPPKELLEPYFFDFVGRSVRAGDRGRADRVSAAGGEVRRAGGAEGADGGGLRARAVHPERRLIHAKARRREKVVQRRRGGAEKGLRGAASLQGFDALRGSLG